MSGSTALDQLDAFHVSGPVARFDSRARRGARGVAKPVSVHHQAELKPGGHAPDVNGANLAATISR